MLVVLVYEHGRVRVRFLRLSHAKILMILSFATTPNSKRWQTILRSVVFTMSGPAGVLEMALSKRYTVWPV